MEDKDKVTINQLLLEILEELKNINEKGIKVR